ncbi:reverse transcriptase domain-containing protein [Tanacetum coccineum]
MAYNDKYKKILDEVWKDRVELDGKIVKEEEEAVKRIKEEALKEKEDPGAFMFPIRLEGQVNENALVDTGSNINTMPFRIFMQLGRDDMNKVDGGITMINHTQAEAIRILTNVLCQVGVTTLIAKFLILDIPIDHDLPIVVGRGFLHTIGGIVNAPERLFSTFDGFCHQTFHDARSDFMRNAESDSDDEEDYQIKRNKFGAPIYGPKPAPYLNCNDPDERSLKEHTMMRPDHHDLNAQDNMKPWENYFFHKFTMNFFYGKDAAEMQSQEIDDMLRIRLREARSDEEIFTSVAWIRAFNINEPIYAELCHEFYSTYEFNEVCADDELQLGLYQAVELEEEGFNVYFEGEWLARKCRVLTEDVVRSLSALIYCRDLDTITLRDLIDSDGKLIPEDPQPGVPRVGIPRTPRESMQDLYDRMGRMEICQKAIERMEYRQSYHPLGNVPQ